MKGETNNKRQAKLLAAVAVMAMVVCALAVAMPAEEADGTATSSILGDGLTLNSPDGLTIESTSNGVKISGTAIGKTTSDSSYNQYFDTAVGQWSYLYISGFTGWLPQGINAAKIIQTNTALGDAYPSGGDGIEGDVKTKDYPSKDDTYYFLIPKDCSNVTIEISSGTGESAKTKTITIDCSDVYTQIQLGSADITGNGYTYAATSSTLSFSGYNGNETFTKKSSLNVDLTGTNIINVDTVCSPSSADGAAIFLTGAGSTLVITGEKGASLTVNQKNAEGMGLAAPIVTIGSNSAGSEITVNLYGGNRAINADSGDNSVITIQNATLNATGSERVIRGGDLTINSSTVTAELIDLDPETNNAGADDRFGMKVDKLTITGTSNVTTDGLRILEAGSALGKGLVTVNGDYTQNPTASMAKNIAGLYYDVFSAGSAITAYTSGPTVTDVDNYVILNNAQHFGNIVVKNSAGTVTESAPESVTDVSGLTEKMNDDSVDSIVISGITMSGGQSITVTKDVIVTGDSTIYAVITSPEAGISVTDGKLNGTISNANNRVTLSNLEGEYSISYGSVEIDGEITGGTVVTEGDVKISGTIAGTVIINDTDANTKMQSVTLNGDLTITSSGSLTIGSNIALIIPANKTLSNNGIVTINGGIAVYGSIAGTNNITMDTGKYAIADSSDVTDSKFGDSTAKKVPIYVFENATGIDNAITGKTEWNTATYLTGDLTIEDGAVVTITGKGFLDLCGYDLIVKGTLIIENRTYVTDSVGGGTMYLASTGDIQNDGVIGYGNKTVTVAMYVFDNSYSGNGSVALKEIKGLQFGKKKTVSGNDVSYTLTVSGDADYNDRTNASISFSGAIVSADMTVKKNVSISGIVTVAGGATLTVAGSSSATVTLLNGASLIAEGSVTGAVSATTGAYTTYNEDGTPNTTGPSGTSSVSLTNLRNVTVTVSSKYYDVGTGDNAVNYTEQMMSVSGVPAFINTNTSGTVTIAGNVYVLSGEVLTLGKGMTVTGAGTVITEGEVTTVNSEIGAYKGSMYAVTSADGQDVTRTYTTFDKAFAKIADADDDTVYLMGGYEFASDVTVADGQKIQFEDNLNYIIGKDATVTIQEGGEASDNFTTIKGILIVMDGGYCEPPTSSYEVRSENDVGDVTYSSAEVAISKATSGMTVYIVKNATFDSAVTVIDGVTVDIADGVAVNANKGIIVSEGGKIVNRGTVVIAAGYDIVVAGDVDNREGTITLGTGSEMTVTGTVTGPQVTGTVNGAVYTSEGYYVYTSVAKAVAAVSAMDVKVQIQALGTFAETGTVTLGQGMSLIVNGANVTLGTIDLDAGSSLTVNGKLTATVTGATGADASAVDASIALTKAGNIRFAESYNSSTKTSYMYVSAVTATNEVLGTVSVQAGNLTVSGGLIFDGKDGSLKVLSGAVVTVPENASITAALNGDAVAVDVQGTMVVSKGTLTVNGIMDVSGTLNVTESGAAGGVTIGYTDANPDTFGTMNVTGAVTVSGEDGKEGRFVINGVLVVGEKPETLGASGSFTGEATIGANGYIKAYSGADMSGALLDIVADESTAVVTGFHINGNLYMTVYTEASTEVTYHEILGAEEFDLAGYDLDKTGNVIENVTSWFTDAEMTKNFGGDTDTTMRNDSDLYYKAFAEYVPVAVSVGQGISLYIDNVRYTSSPDYALSVGTHTVYATVDPGYKGEVTITFNGQTVTDGKFTITPEMASATYEGIVTVSATGSITTDTTVVENDAGMGLTDYLLIVLVVLIVVMAVMVAMRLMRS